MSDQEERPRLRYPNSFLFGAACGFAVQGGMRQFTMEPLAARPLAYVKFALVAGSMMWYWDYWRRAALEHILEREDKLKYYTTVQAMNHNMRIGDEDQISNLTEYLAGSSTRV